MSRTFRRNHEPDGVENPQKDKSGRKNLFYGGKKGNKKGFRFKFPKFLYKIFKNEK